MEMPTRICTQCNQAKTLDKFGWQNHERKISRASCMECDANAESLFGIDNEYEARRAARLFREYGLTPAREEKLLIEQGGSCASCGSVSDEKRLVVDYCHETASVRGLLCPSCQATVGRIGEDLTVMQRALDYLKASGARLSSGHEAA